MSKISLKHSGGNVVSLNSPTNAPGAADVAFKLPNADGSDGQFMKTDGSGNLGFASVADTNDFVKLQSANSTSAISAIEFTSLDVTTYRAFKFICSLRPVDDEVVLYFRWRSGNSVLSSTAYDYILDGANGAGNAFRLANNENKVLICNNMGNGSLEGARFELNLVPQVSGDVSLGNFGYGFFQYRDHNASNRAGQTVFNYGVSTNTDGFELYHNAGNIAAYNYVLYGVKR